jgi:Kdo2-lipid IVA lauroyltransferase/acyltransferase
MANSSPPEAPLPEATPAAPVKRVKARHYIEFGLARPMMTILGWMSLRRASSLGGRLARMLGPIAKPWRIAKRNLANAMPEMSARERGQIAASAFENFGRVMFEYAHLRALWRRRWDGIIETHGDGLSWAVQNKRPAIVFTAHIGNWELIPMILAAAGKPALVVYRAPNNPMVDQLIGDIRSEYAAGLAPKGADGLRMIIEHVQDGGTVFMVVDQKTNTGPEIPFFGRGARTGKAIARVAMKYGCKLIPAHCERLNGAQFRIHFEQPWSVEGDAGNPEHVRQALTRINAKIEDWVRTIPGQWMWMHKRWPDS